MCLQGESRQPWPETSPRVLLSVDGGCSRLCCLCVRCRINLGGGDLIWRKVLWQEVLSGSRHAVIVSPAVDHGQLLTPIAMSGWYVRCLPFKRGGPPRVVAGKLALEQAPHQVEYKHHLGEADDECRDGDKCVQRRGGLGNEFKVA